MGDTVIVTEDEVQPPKPDIVVVVPPSGSLAGKDRDGKSPSVVETKVE